MDPIAIACQVVLAATGENVMEAKLQHRDAKITEVALTTKTNRFFVVYINVETEEPSGMFFEQQKGREGSGLMPENFSTKGELVVELGQGRP